jgi:NADH:ubiquinone oxidoreductase subunit 6 (subunit J)
MIGYLIIPLLLSVIGLALYAVYSRSMRLKLLAFHGINLCIALVFFSLEFIVAGIIQLLFTCVIFGIVRKHGAPLMTESKHDFASSRNIVLISVAGGCILAVLISALWKNMPVNTPSSTTVTGLDQISLLYSMFFTEYSLTLGVASLLFLTIFITAESVVGQHDSKHSSETPP